MILSDIFSFWQRGMYRLCNNSPGVEGNACNEFIVAVMKGVERSACSA